MNYLGTKNGKKYFVEFDEPDYDDIFDPLDNDNPWELVSFDRDYDLNHYARDLGTFQEYLEDHYDIFLNIDLDDFKERCELEGVPENEFFEGLAKKLKRKGVIIRPVSKFEHDSVYFNAGVFGGFDAGVDAIAVTTKKIIRKFWERKRITKKLMKTVNRDLDIEIDHLNDDINGLLYNAVVRDPHDDEVDQLGGIYMSDFDHSNNKLDFVSGLF